MTIAIADAFINVLENNIKSEENIKDIIISSMKKWGLTWDYPMRWNLSLMS